MSEVIVYEGTVPKKNLVMMALMYLKFPLWFYPINKLVQKYLTNCHNVEIIPGFISLYGNIYAKEVFLCDTFFADYAPVYIGEGTKFSFQCMVITSKHDKEDFRKIICEPVNIGKNVYIGARAIILPGVTIGDNCIIGAGSVISKDVPADSFVVGNPQQIKNTAK